MPSLHTYSVCMGDWGWAGFGDGVSVLHCALVSAWLVFVESMQSFGCPGSMDLRGPKVLALGYAYGIVWFVVSVPCLSWDWGRRNQGKVCIVCAQECRSTWSDKLITFPVIMTQTHHSGAWAGKSLNKVVSFGIPGLLGYVGRGLVQP